MDLTDLARFLKIGYSLAILRPADGASDGAPRKLEASAAKPWWPWCRGNTAGCGPVIMGSIPIGHPTNIRPVRGRILVYFFY